MAQVIVAFTTKDQVVSGSVVAGKYNVSIGAVSQDVDVSPVTFDSVAPGDYTASVVLKDSNGGDIGSPSTKAFTVPVPDVTVQVPDVVTVTVS